MTRNFLYELTRVGKTIHDAGVKKKNNTKFRLQIGDKVHNIPPYSAKKQTLGLRAECKIATTTIVNTLVYHKAIVHILQFNKNVIVAIFSGYFLPLQFWNINSN